MAVAGAKGGGGSISRDGPAGSGVNSNPGFTLPWAGLGLFTPPHEEMPARTPRLQLFTPPCGDLFLCLTTINTEMRQDWNCDA